MEWEISREQQSTQKCIGKIPKIFINDTKFIENVISQHLMEEQFLWKEANFTKVVSQLIVT